MHNELIGIVGLGLLGRGIAASFLAHGFRVIVYTKGGENAFIAARQYIGTAIDEFIVNTGADPIIASSWRERCVEASQLTQFSDCTFVVESVTEDLFTKQEAFDELEEVVGSSVPIASNTSALPISTLQSSRKHPERFVGMHWAEPAYATRFLELIRGAQTSDAAMERAAGVGRRLGKHPCFVQKDIPGFIVNRLGYAMYREAVHLLESGVADVETIDRSFQNAFGLWANLCGPFRWIDITGGPELYARAMRGVLPSLNNSPELPQTLQDPPPSFYSYGPGDIERWHKLLHQQAWAIYVGAQSRRLR